MRNTLIIVGTLFVTALLLLGACAPAPASTPTPEPTPSPTPTSTPTPEQTPMPTPTPTHTPPEATPATRDIANQTLAPGESTNVTVTISNVQLQALGLDEDPPADWTVTEVDNGGGQYNTALVEWLWIRADAGVITVIYKLTVPLGTPEGTYEISGTLVSSEGTVAVGGESQITVPSL